MAKRQSTTDSAATDSAATDTTPAAEATSASVQPIEADMPDTTVSAAPEAAATATDTAPAAPTPVELAHAAVRQIEAALAVLGTDNPAAGALQAALDTARGNVALAEAEAALQALKASEIAAATAAAAALPADLLAAMLAAIEAKYAPAAPEVAPEAEATSAAPASGKRPIGAIATERNATVGAAIAGDSPLRQRATATIEAFDAAHAAKLVGVARQAGTRFASIVAFAGDGVENAADYRILATAVRLRLLDAPYRCRENGQGVAVPIWLAARAAHAAGSAKGNDSLPLKFSDRREVVLRNGRFILAVPAAGDLPLRTSEVAWQTFNGTTAAAPASTSTVAVPSSPAAPTPPNVQATASGALATTARCQHCSARNIVGTPECANCGAADWHIA